MFNILAIETSSDACSAALLYQCTTIERYQIAPRQHAQLILPMVQTLLTKAQITLTHLDGIAFSKGPGSFTGIRIATSIAQGLAFGANLPVIPISSLQTLAQTAYRELGAKKVLVVRDARMQEFYWGTYQLNQDNIMTSVLPDSISTAEKIPALKTAEWLTIDDTISPHAQDIITLAKTVNPIPPEQAIPVYLRNENAWT